MCFKAVLCQSYKINVEENFHILRNRNSLKNSPLVREYMETATIRDSLTATRDGTVSQMFSG